MATFRGRGMAEVAAFSVRYDGRDARAHVLDMRAMGTSLIGMDRIINDALVVAFEGRLPKMRERSEIGVVVAAPRAHCVDVPAALLLASGVLPFSQQIIAEYGARFVAAAMAFILSKLGGRPKEADVHFVALMELTKEMQASQNQQFEGLVALNLKTQENFLALADKLRPAAVQTVNPVGRTCDEIIFPSVTGGSPTVIDAAMADAIRAKEPMEVGDMTRYQVHIDTVSISRKTMKVFVAGRDRTLVDALIRDPVFDENPDENIYTDSLGKDLLIDAKPTMLAATGELVKLHVMNAERPA